MSVIRKQDIQKGKKAWEKWLNEAEVQHIFQAPFELRIQYNPILDKQTWAMAVRYTLHYMEIQHSGEGVELRVAPWGAIKILEGPASDPHNLTPPDVIELTPSVWLRLASGITTWNEEEKSGHISAVGDRDNLSAYIPIRH
ncbi:MAG: sterol carrier family protein [Bifidobacteriaceae bacterium]|nr:sterol carrier family protein [Bifidobacteriaceae bacterium]